MPSPVPRPSLPRCGGLLGFGRLFLGVAVSASVASTSVAVSTASMVEVVAVCLLGGVVAVVASV